MVPRKASKGQIKYLQSLKLKKNRLKYASFVAEGSKVVQDLICDKNLNVRALYAIDSFFSLGTEAHRMDNVERFVVSSKELNQISSLRTPHQVVAECSIPSPSIQRDVPTVLFLERVGDPGNLGTIVRACDWFGISQIVLSPDCADLFNPKTVQAAKGSLGRIPYYVLTAAELGAQLTSHQWYLAAMDGASVHELSVSAPYILAVGNESHGLSESTLSMTGATKVSLPKRGTSSIDSLNVAMASTALMAIFCR